MRVFVGFEWGYFTSSSRSIGRRAGGSTMTTTKPVGQAHTQAIIPLKTAKNQTGRA
jgi:hypothetical protein